MQATREHLIHQYGTLAGRRQHDRPDVYAIDTILEKPNPTTAELRTTRTRTSRAGARPPQCFFGMHVLTPAVFDLLDDLVARDVREERIDQLTTALNARESREVLGPRDPRHSRHNTGVKYGVVEAQIAGLWGVDRERMLAGLLESVVRVERGSRGE